MNPLKRAMRRSESRRLAWDAAIDQIHALDIRAALERYGVEVGRGGFVCCPFHNETKGSMKLYDNNTYYCFGCHQSGDLIDFTMRRFGMDFRSAVAELCREYGIPLGAEDTDVDAIRRRKAAVESEASQRKARYFTLWNAYLDALTAWLDISSAIPVRAAAESNDAFLDRFCTRENALLMEREAEARYLLDEADAALGEYTYSIKHRRTDNEPEPKRHHTTQNR